jgi:phosphoribosyl-ATP pyrophosphohydrolase/phosphoribosyl-AMP cyclohydrolase
MTLENLYQLIVTRKEELPENSYLTSLFTEGDDRIIQKVGEEAIEVVIAAKGTDKERVISEMADLWFHSLVLLASKGITPEDILVELEKRDKKK